MKTATRIRTLDWDTDAAQYRLAPPVNVDGVSHEHVAVSALHPVNGDKGCIVLAVTADGQVVSWDPIARSESADHAQALAELGYEVTRP